MSRLAVTLLLVSASLTWAATSTAATPSRAARVTAELQAFIDAHDLPGATAAWVLPDGRVETVAAGIADRDTNTPMTATSRMLAASVGKTFVGAAVIALVLDGVLDMDAPISAWLGDRPWFTRLPNAADISIRHLLTHSSGVPDHVNDPAFAAALARRWRSDGAAFTPEQLVGFVLDHEPLFAVGEGWAYSDTGYVLLGLIIEAATGHPYIEVLRARFLVPLALDATDAADRRDIGGLATGYTSVDNPFGLPVASTIAPGVMAWHPGVEFTGGGLVSNARDLAVWGAALYEGRALAAPYLELLLASVPTNAGMTSLRYGAGVSIRERSPLGPVYGHAGWIPGYVTSLRYYPDARMAIAFQINSDVGLADGPQNPLGGLEARLLRLVRQETTATTP